MILGIALLLTGVTVISGIGKIPIEKNPSPSISFNGLHGNTLYVGGSGPDNYTTIQAAVNAASSGDTVFVYQGIYEENVEIQKSINMSGEEKQSTVIDGDNRGNVVDICSEEVAIRGFTIRGGGGRENEAGVRIASDHVTLTDNVVTDNRRHGIALLSASHCTITDNIVTNNRYDGLHLTNESNFNDISSNLIVNHTRDPFDCHGVHMRYSSHNILENNTLSDNAGYDFFLIATTSLTLQDNVGINSSGIFFTGGTVENWNTHTLEENMVDGKPVYYYADVHTPLEVPSDAGEVILANCSQVLIQGLSIHDGDCAVLLGFSTDNTIRDNNISGVIAGVWLTRSTDNVIADNTIGQVGGSIPLALRSNRNVIRGNTISDNWEYGIGVWSGSSFNTITENNVTDNTQPGLILSSAHFNAIERNSFYDNNWYGAYLTSAYGNRFVKNNFMHHHKHVYFEDSFLNTWSQNYWDDHEEAGPKTITGKNTVPWNPDKTIDWTYYDWRPATEPYDIDIDGDII